MNIFKTKSPFAKGRTARSILFTTCSIGRVKVVGHRPLKDWVLHFNNSLWFNEALHV
jgi:hypothetical protein